MAFELITEHNKHFQITLGTFINTTLLNDRDEKSEQQQQQSCKQPLIQNHHSCFVKTTGMLTVYLMSIIF